MHARTSKAAAAAPVLALVAALLAASPSAGAEEPVLLRLKGKAGERYRHQIEVTARTSLPESGAASELVARMTIETRVEAVKPSGRMTLSQRILSVRIRTDQEGQVVEFDSRDPRQLEAARANPDMAALLEALKATVRMEQEPTGQLRRTEGGGVESDPLLEQVVGQGNVLFPDKPVGPLETWDGGKITKPVARLGRLQVANEVVLLHVRREGAERIAFVGIRETARLLPDEESGVTAEMTEYEGGGVVVLAVERGRIERIQGTWKATFRVRDGGETFTLRIEGGHVMQEIR